MALIDRILGRTTPEQVVQDHGPEVLRQLKRIFGPGADVDDVFQAVFVEILRSLPSFKGRSKMRTWVHRITLNVAYQEMRMQYRNGVTTSIETTDEPVATTDLEGELADAQARALLYRGLEQLDPKKRMAIVLHDLRGLTLKKTAEELGRPLQTVASQVRSGRAELAEWLNQAMHGTGITAEAQKEHVR